MIAAFSNRLGEYVGLVALLALVLAAAAVVFSIAFPRPVSKAEREAEQLAERKRGRG